MPNTDDMPSKADPPAEIEKNQRQLCETIAGSKQLVGLAGVAGGAKEGRAGAWARRPHLTGRRSAGRK